LQFAHESELISSEISIFLIAFLKKEREVEFSAIHPKNAKLLYNFYPTLPPYDTTRLFIGLPPAYVSYGGRVECACDVSGRWSVWFVRNIYRTKGLFDCSARLFVMINFMNPYETWVDCSLISVVSCSECWMASDNGKCRF
jgi:hypothetical protein